jgi:1-aminocyclopropane-1-carboxylate deaminase/D-cysteine desulfhydrase-like pyridoxal-dependent ACC family enzyme
MSEAILATVLGRAVTLFASCVELATPRFASAPKTLPKTKLTIPWRPRLPSERNGNLFLDEIFGADITVFKLEEGSSIMGLHQVQKFVDPVIERAKKAGRKPYLAPIGGSRLEGSMNRPLGSIAYVNAMLELTEQAEAQELAIDQLVFATSSGSTHAGLLAGARLLALRTKIVGISVSEAKDEIVVTE